MNRIGDLLEGLSDSEGLATRLEEAVRQRPEDQALALNLAAIRKRGADLRRKLATEVRRQQIDLIEYGLRAEQHDHYPINAIGESMQHFQEVVTSIFDALRAGPKRRFRVSADNWQLSTFNLALARPGSLVLSFTIPNERLLLVESELDMAIKLALDLLQANTADQIQKLVEKIGIAPVTKAYQWSNIHARHRFTAKVRWSKDIVSGSDYEITADEADRLRSIIEQVSETNIQRVSVFGRLVGLDVKTNFFHIETAESGEIRGSLAEHFPISENWEINRHYRAEAVRQTQIKYATGEETELYQLVALLLDANQDV
jgi:hypothetical protein